MLQRKRKLKKEKTKQRFKLAFISLISLLAVLTLFAYLNAHFSFGGKTYISPLSEGKLVFSDSLENRLSSANVKFKSVSSNPDGSISVNLTDGGYVVLSSKKDIVAQISSLQLILSRLTIEGKKLKTLDFRYDNPVVSF